MFQEMAIDIFYTGMCDFFSSIIRENCYSVAIAHLFEDSNPI